MASGNNPDAVFFSKKQKNFQKSLDKFFFMWYNIKAVRK